MNIAKNYLSCLNYGMGNLYIYNKKIYKLSKDLFYFAKSGIMHLGYLQYLILY